jgi:hypothetical protein
VAKKDIAVKKYVVKLSDEERERLETLIHSGKSSAQTLNIIITPPTITLITTIITTTQIASVTMYPRRTPTITTISKPDYRLPARARLTLSASRVAPAGAVPAGGAATAVPARR